MSINKRLDALFEEIEHDIEAAKDETELIEVINKISNFGQPLKYDNTWPAIIATMATITAVVMIYLPFHSYSNNPVFFMPASLIAAVVAGMAFFIWGSRASKADTYADKLFAKDVLFDNVLTPVECNPERQHKAWASSFLEFNRCVCSAQRTYGFDEPDKFKKEVAAVNVPVSLDLLLNLAHKLMEQHDNNFKDIK